MNRSIYLAGPHDAEDHRRAATEALTALGYRVIDPMRRDYRGLETGNAPHIIKGDLADIVECDLVLANFSGTVPRDGTAMECWFAHSIGRPVISFFEGSRRSPWAVYVSEAVCGWQPEAIEYIRTQVAWRG